MRYHINPETGNVLVCKAKHRCRFGSEAAHYETQEEARAAYERKAQLSVLTSLTKNVQTLSRGAKLLLALDRAQHAIADRLRQNEAEGRDTYDDGQAWGLANAQIDERNALQKKLRALPWDHSDEPTYDDDEVVVPFRTRTFTADEPRRGFDKDSFTPSEEAARMYEQLDRASAVWIARLSTAEIKAVVLYNEEARFYAQAMAGEEVTLRDYDSWDPTMIPYLHSAVRKAPRVELPYRAYAGISGPRTVEVNRQAQAGLIELNRVQSASMNPAQVNGFMTPSSWLPRSNDETAVEFYLDRVASLSAFNVHKDEMEVLVPPGNYEVSETHHGVPYYWGSRDGKDKDSGLISSTTYVVRSI